MKLYFSPGACSLAPHIVAREADVQLELERVVLKTAMTASGRPLAAIHPKAYVPLLELDDGRLLSEGPVIARYLADLRPEAALVPAAGTMDRYRVEEWQHYIGTELHKAFGPLFHGDLDGTTQDGLRSQIVRRFEVAEQTLARQSHLAGEQFTVADAYLFTVMRWARPAGITLSPVLAEYFVRIAARPAVITALEAEGLLRRKS